MGSGVIIQVSGSAAGRDTVSTAVLLLAGSNMVALEFPGLRPGMWTFTIIAVTDQRSDEPSGQLLPGSPREAEAVVLAPQLFFQAAHPQVNGLPEVRAGETVDLALAVAESVMRTALTFTLSGSGVRFSGEDGVMIPGGIAPVSLTAAQSMARVSIPDLVTGIWEFAVVSTSPSGEVNLDNARTGVRVRPLELRFGADTLLQSVVVGEPVVLAVVAESALPAEIVFGVQGTSDEPGATTRSLSVTIGAGETAGAVTFTDLPAGLWVFSLVDENFAGVAQPAGDDAQVTVVPLSAVSLSASPLEIFRSAAVTLTLSVSEALLEDTVFSIAGSIGDTVHTQPPLVLTLPARMNTATLSYRPQELGEWIFRVTAAAPEGAVIISAAQAPPVTVQLPPLGEVNLRAADPDRRVPAGRDVVILLELSQSLDSDAALTVRAEGPGGMSRVASVTLRSGVIAASTTFSGLEPGHWQFTVSSSFEGLGTEGAMVTLDVVPRSVLSLSVLRSHRVANGNVLLSGQRARVRITAIPPAIDDAVLRLQWVSFFQSRVRTVTLPADTATVTVNFDRLQDTVRGFFDVVEIVPDDLFEAAAGLTLQIRRPQGILSAERSIVSGSMDLPLTVTYDFPAGSAASDNFDNQLIAISPAGVETSRTDRFGAVPPSMSYHFRQDSSAADHAFAGVDRTDGVWTFRHECSSARATCGQVVRVHVGPPPDAALKAVFPWRLAESLVPISLRLSAEAVGDLRFTVLAHKTDSEESTSTAIRIRLPEGRSALEFNFPPLSVGTWAFSLDTQTVYINPRAGDTEGAGTELVRRDSLAAATATVVIGLPSSVNLSRLGEEETVLAGALLLGRQARLRIAAMPPPVGEMEVVLSGSSGMEQIEPQTVILSPSTPARSVRVQPSVAGDWLFSIDVNVPRGGAAGQVDATASTVQLTVAPPSAVQLLAPRFAVLNRSIPLRLELERGLSTQQASFDIGVSVAGMASTALLLTLPSSTTIMEREVLLDVPGDWVFTVTAARGVSPVRAVVFADASATVTVGDKPRAILQVSEPSPVLIEIPIPLLLSLSLPLLSSVSLTVRGSHDGTAPMRTWTVVLPAQEAAAAAYTDVLVVVGGRPNSLETGLWTFQVDANDALGPPLNELQVEVRLPRVMLELAATEPVMPGEPVRLLLRAEQAPGGSGARIQVSGSAAGRSPVSRTVLLPAESITAALEFPELRSGMWTFTITAVTDPDTDGPSERLLPGSPGEAEAVVLAPQVSLRALHPEVNGLPEVAAGETVELELAVAESTVRPALTFMLSGSGMRFSGESGVMIPGGIAPVSLTAVQSTARVSIPGLVAGTWSFTVDTASPSGEVNLDNAGTSMRVRLPEASLGALPLETLRGAAVTLTLRVTAALMEDTEFSITGSIGDTVQTQPPLALTLPAGMNAATLSYRPQEPGEWIFQVTAAAPENRVDISAAQAPPVTVRVPEASLSASSLEILRGAAVTLTLHVTEALMENTEFSITGSIEDTVQTQPPLVLTLPAGMNAATLSYRPQEPGEWIFQVTAVAPEGAVNISSAQAPPVTVRLPRLRAVVLQNTVAQGAAVRVGIETDLPLLSTVTVRVQALRRGTPPLMREMMTLLQVQEQAGPAGEVEFGPGVLLSGDWDITLAAVQPAGRAEIDSGASAAVAVAAQLVLKLDLSPGRVNAGDSVDAVLCRALSAGSCPASDVEGAAAYGISTRFRLQGQRQTDAGRVDAVFSDVIEIDAQQTTSTKPVELGPLPMGGFWRFTLAGVDEMPLPADVGITLSAPQLLVDFAAVLTQVRLEAVTPEVTAGELVILGLVFDGIPRIFRQFVLRGSNHLGMEADPLTLHTGSRAATFANLPPGLWSFSLTENLVSPNTQTISVVGTPQVRVGFPAITVEGPEAPGVFSSDGISYASLSSTVILSVSTSIPPRQQVTFMLRGESSSGEVTQMQSVTRDTEIHSAPVSFSVPSQGLWTFGIVQQDPANTVDLAVPSASALVRVGLPPLRLSGFDSRGSGEDMRLRLSSPLAVTGDFIVKGVNGSSSLTRTVSFAQELQKDINFGRLDSGRWSFRVIGSSPTGAADLSRAQRDVMVEDGMRFTVRFQPGHANTVRYDSTRSRYFALEGSEVRALFRTPNGAPDLNPGDEICRENVRADVHRQIGSETPISIASRLIGRRASSGQFFVCAGETRAYNLDVPFAVAGRYSFSAAAGSPGNDPVTLDIRTVYAEAPPAVESFSPEQNLIAITQTAVLNLQLREPAVVDSRFTVQAQDISPAGSSLRFNTIQVLRGKRSATASFRNMEQGTWSFTLVQTNPPLLLTPQLLATVPARVVAGRLAVRIEAPAVVPDAEVVLRLVPDVPLQADTTVTVTATGMPAGGGSAFAPMMQIIHLPAGMPSAEETFSGLSPGSWLFSITGVEPESTVLDLSSTAAVTTGGLRAELRAADLDGRVQAGRDVVIQLELPQSLDSNAILTVSAEGPGDISRVAQVTLRRGVRTVSAVFADLEPGQWQFTVSASVEEIKTEGVMVTLDVVSRSALSLRVQGAANLADTGNVLPSALAVQLRITAAPAAIDDATLTLRAVSGTSSQMMTVTLPADTTAATADFGVLPDGVWRFSVTDAAPDDLFDVAAAVEVEIRKPRGILMVRTIVSGGIDLPLTVSYDFPAGSAASDNFANRLIAVSPAGVQTSRTDSFGAVPSSMVYSFGSDASAVGHAFAGVVRTDGIWTFRHECPAARAFCGEQGALRVRVGDPPNAVLEVVSPRTLAGRPVPVSLRLSAETVGDLRLTVLARKTGTEESTSAVMVLSGDQTELEFNFPPLSAGTWVFRPSTRTVHVNPRAGDAEGAATELVLRDSLATVQTTVEVVLPSSIRLSGPGEEETVLTGALLLGREAVLRIAAIPPPVEELEVVLSGSSGMAQIEPQTVILSPSTPARSARVQPSVAGDWLFSIAVNVPSDGLAAGQVNPDASSVMLTVAPPSAVRLAAPRFAAFNRNIPLRLELERGLSTQQATFDISVSVGGVARTSPLTLTLPSSTTSAESEVLADALGDWVFTVTAVRGVSPARAVAFADASATVTVADKPQAMLRVLPPSPVLAGIPIDLRLNLNLPLLSSVSLTVRGTHDGTASPRSWTVNLAAQQGGDEAYADVTVFSALTNLEAGLWTFEVSTHPALGPPLTLPTVEVLPPEARLDAEPLETVPGAAVALTLSVTAALVEDTEFSITGSIGDTVQTQLPLALTLLARASTATLSYRPQDLGEWIFRVTAVAPEGAVNISSAQTPPVTVRLPRLRAVALQNTAAQGSAVRVGVQTDLPLLATVTVRVQALRRGALSLVRETMVLLQIQEQAGSAGEAEFGPGELLSGDWDITLAAVQPAGRAEVDSSASAAVAVAAPLLRLSAVQQSVLAGTAAQLRVRAEGSDGMKAAPDTTVTVTVEGICSCGGTTTTLTQAITLSAAAVSGEAEFAGEQLQPGVWQFAASATPAGFLDLSETRPVTVTAESELVLPVTLMVSPSTPATAVRGELVVLSIEAVDSTIIHGGFSAQVLAVASDGSTQQLSVPVAAGQPSGTHSFVPARSGLWQFTLDTEAAAGTGSLILDASPSTLTLTVEEAQLDVSMPEGIDADDLVLALRILRLCPPPGGCSASGVTEDSLRLNLRQGAGPMPLESLRLPDVAGDGVDRGQADTIMLLDYLSGVRGDALFPPGAPLEFREERLQVIEDLLGR